MAYSSNPLSRRSTPTKAPTRASTRGPLRSADYDIEDIEEFEEIDFDQAEAPAPRQKYPKSGEFLAELIDITNIVAKTGTPGWEWTFVIVEDGEYNGAVMKAKTYNSPKALWKTQQYLEALGIKAQGRFKFNKPDLLGREAVIVVVESAPNSDGNTFGNIETLKAA